MFTINRFFRFTVPPAAACLALLAAGCQTASSVQSESGSARAIGVRPVSDSSPVLPTLRREEAPSPRPSKLDLTGKKAIQGFSFHADENSPREWVLGAFYLAEQGQHREATEQFFRIADRLGPKYESVFARNAYREALRNAWTCGDATLFQKILGEHDRKFDALGRIPEPPFITALRRFFAEQNDQALSEGYQRLAKKLPDLPHEIIARERSRWLKRHQDVLIGLACMYRDKSPKDWDIKVLDELVEVEATLVGGFVDPASEILIFAAAERLARQTGRSTNEEIVMAAAKVFLERSYMVGAMDQRDRNYLWGHVYNARSDVAVSMR